jgi:hypothetical protein
MNRSIARLSGFKLMDQRLAAASVDDIPSWVLNHPMRWYYRHHRETVSQVSTVAQCWSVRDDTTEYECVLQCLDERVCVIVLNCPPERQQSAEVIRQSLRDSFGRIPIVLKKQRGIQQAPGPDSLNAR